MTLLHNNTFAITFFASLFHLHLMHCIISLLVHICLHTLDHTEPELEEPTEQAQAENLTNLALDQGKLWCNTPLSLTFILNHYLYVKIDCALGL
jgi:hypothetical protein